MTDSTEDYNYGLSNDGGIYDEYYLNENNSQFGLCETKKVEHVYPHLSLYVHSIIAVLGLLGNLLVIVTYAFYKKTKSMTDVYLLNVAVADILFVVVLPFIIYNEHHNWVMGAGACKFLKGAYSLNLYSGVLLLGCISGDRYLAIVCASRSRYLRSRTLVYSHAICFVVWLMALLISLPTFIYSTTDIPKNEEVRFYENSTDNDELKVECILYFNNTETAYHMKVLIPSLQMGIGFLMPLMVMTFCYTCVILTLLKARNFQRHKAVRVVLSVVLVFIICHLPYNLALLVHTITLREEKECEDEDDLKLGLELMLTLSYLHCCLNPFLYAFVGVRFRNHFQKVLRDLWCIGKGYMQGQRRSSRMTSEICLSTRKSFDGSNTDNATSFTM